MAPSGLHSLMMPTRLTRIFMWSAGSHEFTNQAHNQTRKNGSAIVCFPSKTTCPRSSRGLETPASSLGVGGCSPPFRTSVLLGNSPAENEPGSCYGWRPAHDDRPGAGDHRDGAKGLDRRLPG